MEKEMEEKKEEEEEKKEEEEEKKKEEEEEEDPSLVWKKFTETELEHQYSPSRWSQRHGEEVIISKHVEEARQRSEVARGAVAWREQRYHRGPRALLDVFGEDLPGNSPLLVYVHGGYWQQLDKNVSAHIVPPLFGAGVVVVVVGYDLAPQVGVADIVEEVRAAVVWACKLARERGSVGVVLAGWSAGGQLVTQVLSEQQQQQQSPPPPPPAGQQQQDQEQDQPRSKDANVTLAPFLNVIKGVVTLSGVFDLRPLVTTYVNHPLHLTPDTAWFLSPLRHVRALGAVWGRGGGRGGGCGEGGGLKMLAVVGEEDPPEFKRQSEDYVEACNRNGLESQFLIIDGADHFSLVGDLFLPQYPLTSRLLTFIDTCCGRRKD